MERLSLVAAAPKHGLGNEVRLAKDGTRWCAYCDITVTPWSKETYCDDCDDFRDRFRHGPAAHAYMSLPTEVVLGLIGVNARSRGSVSRANAARALREGLTPEQEGTLFESFYALSDLVSLIEEYVQSMGRHPPFLGWD